MSEWACPQCTFSNAATAARCDMCGAFRQAASVAPIAQPPPPPYAVAVATPAAPAPFFFQQRDPSVVRSEQQQANYIQATATAANGRNGAAGDGWSCNHCSMLNSASHGRCIVCDCTRPAALHPIFRASPTPAVSHAAAAASASYMPASALSPRAAAASSSAAAAAATPRPLIRAVSGAGAALAPGEWQCQQCTFINPASGAGGVGGLACEVCAHRPAAPAASASASALLPANGAAAHRPQQLAPAAAAAAVVASSGSNPGSSSDSSWHCGLCSLLNTSDAMRCVVCHNLSPNVSAQAFTPVAGPPPVVPPRSARGKIVQSRPNGHQALGFNNAPPPGQQPRPMVPLAAAASSSASSALLDPSGEESAALQWREIMSICVATGHNFVDDSFRPGDRSVYGEGAEALAMALSRRVPITDPVTGLAPAGAPATKRWGPFGWRRGQQLTKHSPAPWCVLPFDPATGRADIKPSDIRQGELGNCWFVSALSVLAERPQLLEHLLITQEINDVGAYQVRFCKGGRWVTVTVDDFFPVHPDSGRLAFSHSPNNELWVALVEKAYAKLHGSYAAIESGSICDAFTDLTGAPAERLEMHLEEMTKFSAAQAQRNSGGDIGQQQEILWATILSFRQSKFLMGASCGKRNTDPEVYRCMGLRSDHAYALLDARIEQGIHFIKLRNPWGTQSWLGDWSASSPLWTPSLRRALNYPVTRPSHPRDHLLGAGLLGAAGPGGEDSGVFWMTFSDFRTYFRTIDVCKYQDDWHVVRLADSFPLSGLSAGGVALSPHHVGWTSQWMYELAIPKSTCCFISLIQPDLRGTNAPKPHTYSNQGLFLLKTSGSRGGPDTLGPVEANLGAYQRCKEVFPEAQRMVTCEALLTEQSGRYLLIPCSYAATIANGSASSSAAASSSSSAASSSAAARASSASAAAAASSVPFILCIYSAHPILVKRRPVYVPALTLGLHLGAMFGSASKALSDDAHLFTFECQGGLWFVVVNRHPTKFLSISVDCTGSVGLVSSRRSAHQQANPFKTQDLVPPRHRQLLIALLTTRAENGYSYQRSCTFMHVDGVSFAGQPHTPPLRRGFDIHQPLSIDHSRVSEIC